MMTKKTTSHNIKFRAALFFALALGAFGFMLALGAPRVHAFDVLPSPGPAPEAVLGIVKTPFEEVRVDGDRNEVTLLYSYGGGVKDFIATYISMASAGTKLRIMGECDSACTYFLGLLPAGTVCAGPGATFGFHGIYMHEPDGRTYFDAREVALVHPLVYPPRVLKLLRDRGFDGTKDVDRSTYPDGLIVMDRDTLAIRHCEG